MVVVVPTEVYVSLTMVIDIRTVVFAVWTTVLVVLTKVFVTPTMVLIALTTVFVVPTMVPGVGKMFPILAHSSSEAETILRTSEAGFCNTEKTGGARLR